MSSVHAQQQHPKKSNSSLPRPPSASRIRPMQPPATSQHDVDGPALPSLAYAPSASNPSVASSNYQGNGLHSARVRRPQGGPPQSSPTSETSSPVSARSNPHSAAERGRQSSLKELVERFNQKPHDDPPVAHKSYKSTPRASRAPSAKPDSRSQTTSPSHGAGKTSFENVRSHPKSSFPDTNHVVGTNGSPRRMSSQSPQDIRIRRTSSNSDDPRQGPSSPGRRTHRRPLFGEILATSHDQNGAGFGINASYRRRGSEGSMHSPNPMFPPDPSRSAPWSSSHQPERRDDSPTSEEILTDESSSPARSHRPSRRDIAGAPTLPSHAYDPDAAGGGRDHGGSITSQTKQEEQQPRSTTRCRSPRRKPISQSSIHLSSPPSHHRDSQSRIPLSSRRRSGTSDSATSPPSTRANSSTGRHPTSLPSPSYTHHPSTPSTPHHRQVQRSDQRGAPPRLPISPSLNAYIQAPLPKKSPPLRSSRPRQHVSNATTAASRARHIRSGEEHRPSRPLDLGGVDFAARRQKIQQAFTRTMTERDKHREPRKKREVPDGAGPGPSAPPSEDTASTSQHMLTVDTSQHDEKSALGVSQEDSPTLGNMNFGRNNSDATDSADIEPSSAVTAETSDSVDTFFDDEPQDASDERELEELGRSDRAESLRDPSPSSRQSMTRPDDSESIQIMLGETPILHQGPVRSSGLRHEYDMESADPHLSVSTTASEPKGPAWSPDTSATARTARTTMDSDAYSTINRVLDHYHDPSVVSPEMMHDIQQQIYTRSPDLARQGGWDPKKVTQIYLQELARSRCSRQGSLADGLRRTALQQQQQQQPEDRSSRSASVSQPRESTDEKTLSPEQPGHSRSTSLEVAEAEVKPQRASMNHPDDWNMSPSIVDWIAPQAADSPSEGKPPLSIKRPRELDGAPSETDHEEPSQSIGMLKTARPELPQIEGTEGRLGLAINVTSPQDGDSPKVGLSPPSSYQPPPPPTSHPYPIDGASSADKARSPKPSSIYGGQFSVDEFTPRVPAGSVLPTLSPQGTERLSASQSSPGMPQQPSITSEQSSERSGLETPQSSTDQVKPALSPEEQKRLTQRGHIIKEFVETEHSFGQDMIVVADIYRGTSSLIVSEADVKILFGNSDQVLAFAATFLDALKKAAKSTYILPSSKRWKGNRQSDHTSHSEITDDQGLVEDDELNDYEKDRKTFIGQAFRRHIVEMEKVYGAYVKNLSASNDKLQALQKEKGVPEWLAECRTFAHDLTTAWDLDSLLVKPVQRILKYHLMLTSLLQHTPADHPDHGDLGWATQEMKEVGDRLNELKRKQEVINAVHGSRKRKESDVRTGIAKAFGRRAEKFKQEVTPVKVEEDKEYAKLAEKYGDHFFQLQVVMRDVEMYTKEVDTFVNSFNDLCVHIEDFVFVEQSSYPELESKWRKFRMLSRDMLSTALPDHIAAVRKHVIEPMTSLLKLHGGPQKFMQKREKRFADYTRFMAIKARGDKPDKKTTDQSEQYKAISDTLKIEIPKLFSLTGKLVEACLNNFVQIQQQWNVIWRKKLSQAIESSDISKDITDIITSFSGDFAFHEAQALTLGICNGSLRADTPNLVGMLSAATTLHSEDHSSLKRSSASDSQKRRTVSVTSENSPMLPHPDLGTRAGGGLFGETTVSHVLPQPPTMTQVAQNRARASSSISNGGHVDIPGPYRSWSNSINAPNNTPSSKRPSTATARSTGPPLSRPSMETPSQSRLSQDSTLRNRSTSDVRNSLLLQQQQQQQRPQQQPPSQQLALNTSTSNFFSSAMPMSDSPHPDHPPSSLATAIVSPPPSNASPSYFPQPQPTTTAAAPPQPSLPPPPFGREPQVIFLAASVYEFNIDRARREAGFPYLTYVAGEIFDVLGEKGELWLARNQDDRTKLVGWIWNKHFVKLGG